MHKNRKIIFLFALALLMGLTTNVYARANPCYACGDGNYRWVSQKYTSMEATNTSRPCNHGHTGARDYLQIRTQRTTYRCDVCGDSYYIDKEVEVWLCGWTEE